MAGGYQRSGAQHAARVHKGIPMTADTEIMTGTMTGAEVYTIRNALAEALGRKVSCRDLGLVLSLAPSMAGETVRAWEDGKKPISGPASVALRLLGYGAGIGEIPDSALARAANNDLGDDGLSEAFRQAMLGVAESLLVANIA
jgi:hypothetical protein